MLFRSGKGVEQDYAEAMKWYRMAADQGRVHAQTCLAFVYEKENNYAEATKWYRLAADQGDTTAQFNLSLLLIRDGSKGALEEAKRWLIQALGHGYEKARGQLNAVEKKLADIYRYGP